MIKSKIRKVSKSRGVKDSSHLAQLTGIPPAMAERLWDAEVTLFTVDVIDKLCTALECQPGDLLIWKKESKSAVEDQANDGAEKPAKKAGKNSAKK